MTIYFIHERERKAVAQGLLKPAEATVYWDQETAEYIRTNAKPPVEDKKDIIPEWLQALLFVLFLLGAAILTDSIAF